MTKVGGKFTREKRNLVTYIEPSQYELLRKLAQQNGRSVSAEAAWALLKHLEEHEAEIDPQFDLIRS
ncbi:MAG: TraY domain-containing protein [Anaerolineae bacterium]|nr:TraY domain-containing protein [Anaerolineae bacterium]